MKIDLKELARQIYFGADSTTEVEEVLNAALLSLLSEKDKLIKGKDDCLREAKVLLQEHSRLAASNLLTIAAAHALDAVKAIDAALSPEIASEWVSKAELLLCQKLHQASELSVIELEKQCGEMREAIVELMESRKEVEATQRDDYATTTALNKALAAESRWISALDKARQALSPSAGQEWVGDAWIPVENRLPEPWDSVLLFRSGHTNAFPGYLGEESFRNIDDKVVPNVTHWQPMPDAPKSLQSKEEAR